MNESAESSPAPQIVPLLVNPVLPVVSQPASRKRKRTAGGGAAPSPGPETEDGASTLNTQARQRLEISRHPVFVPISDDSPFHTSDVLAFNRLGFRYTPAGVTAPGSALACRTIESNPRSYRVGWEDRSSFIKVTKDGLGLLGEKGFRSARCNAPIREGQWYMEVKIENHVPDAPTRQESHVRLGWGRREAPLNGPVGLDGYSYGMRDKTGEKVTLSRPKPYGRPFGPGDVVGMYISLPPHRKATDDPHDPAIIKRERIAIEFKQQEYFESLEYPHTKEMNSLMDYSGKTTNTTSVPSSATKKSATVKNLPDRGRTNAILPGVTPLRLLPTLPQSHVAFFINGECQGVAFSDLYDYLQLRNTDSARKNKTGRRKPEGTREHKENPFDDGSLGYYPFISLFNHASVRLNPGPDFAFPPPVDIESLLAGAEPPDIKERRWRPMCERYAEFMAEQWAIDAKEEEEAQVELADRAKQDEADAVKLVQKNKRRQQAEARKLAKKAQMEQIEGRSTPVLGQPSPLRQAVAYPSNTYDSQDRSPAPSRGLESGYNSEDGQLEEDVPTPFVVHDLPSEIDINMNEATVIDK